MRVLEQPTKAVEVGAELDLEELGIPAPGTNGLLIVFWRER